MKLYVCFLATVALAIAGQIQEIRVNPATQLIRVNSAANTRSSSDYGTATDPRSAAINGNYVNRGVEAFRTNLNAAPVVYRAGSLPSDSTIVASRITTANQSARSVTPAQRTSNKDFITVNVVSNGPVTAAASSSSLSSPSTRLASSSAATNVNSVSTDAVATNSVAGTRSSGGSYGTSQSAAAAPAFADATYESTSANFSPALSSLLPSLPFSPAADAPLLSLAPAPGTSSSSYGYGSSQASLAADFPFQPVEAEIQATNEFEGIPGTANVDYPVFASIPATSFSCVNQQYSYGYYADVEASCQVFHICQDQGFGQKLQQSFLCPNGTIFDQRTLVCNWWYNVNCQDSPMHFSNNANFGVTPAPPVRSVVVPAASPTVVAVREPVPVQTVTTYTLRATPELLELLQRSSENSASRSANGAAY